MKTSAIIKGKKIALLAFLFLPLLAACGDSTSATSTPGLSVPDVTASSTSGSAATAVAATAIPATVTAGPTVTAASGLQKITLSLGYQPDVQFAPYYVAQDKGYYQQEGLDVNIQYGGSNDLLTIVGRGDIAFANVSGDEMTTAKAQGVPVTYVFTQYYGYPVAAVAITGQKAPLTKPADLKGRTIGVPALYGSTYIGLLALLKAGGLTQDDVKIVNIGYTQVASLTQGKVDVAMVYSMNEPEQLKAQGKQIETLEVSQFSKLASVGIVTGDSTIQNNKDLVQRFIRATLKGIQDTIGNPDGAYASSMARETEISDDAKALQRSVLTATIPFMKPPMGEQFGFSDPSVWAYTEQFLRDIGTDTKTVDPSTLYTNEFIAQ